MKKIILIGASLSNNKGAEAMTLGAISILNKWDTNNEYIILSYYINDDKLKINNFTNIKLINFHENPGGIINNLCLLMLNKFFKIKFKNPILRSIDESDLIADVSGDSLNDNYGFLNTIYQFKIHIYCIFLNKKYLFFPQSLGPFKNYLTTSLAKYIFNHSLITMTREEISFNYLKHLNIKTLKLGVDLAFGLPYRKNNLNTKNMKVGISISQAIIRFSRLKKSTEKKYFISFTRFLDDLIKKYNAQIYLFPQVIGPGPKNDDRIISLKIIDTLNSKNIHFYNEDLSPSLLKSRISQMDFFVGTRMHANIGALSSNIPTLVISYSHKSEGILSLYKLEKYSIKIEQLSLNKLKIKFEELFINRDKIRSQLRTRNQFIKDELLNTERIILNKLNS